MRRAHRDRDHCRRPGIGLTALALVGALLLAAVLAQSAAAAVEVPFASQFATSARGGLAVAANTLMTCPDGAGTEVKCLQAREGKGESLAALNNNAYKMERVDVDSDASTFDSSSASLALPAGATVQFAGLYFGARTSAGTSGAAAPNASARGTVAFRPPGATGYSSLTGAISDSSAIANSYVGFVDVTGAVAAAGSGTYTVANVQSGTGVDRYAGWSLIVAYTDPASPPRSLRVYDGLATIQQSDPPLQIAVTGLETPPSGPVTAEVGVVGYEGDRGSSGDRLSLAGTPLSDAANPATNVFNSSIAVDGTAVSTGVPSYIDQLGFDADVIGANGVLGNEVTTATLEESTSVEQYLTQAVAVSVDLNPTALETPVSEPPTPEPPPTHYPPTEEKSEKKDEGGEEKHHHSGAGDPGGGARLTLDVSGPEAPVIRPSEVISLAITVRSTGGKPAHDVRVCNQLPAALQRLTAPKASAARAMRVCWQIENLPAGTTRRVRTTARVEAVDRSSLQGTTVLSAANTARRRATTKFQVVPLPRTPCARPARAVAEPEAHTSC